jgi:hypothetical protein
LLLPLPGLRDFRLVFHTSKRIVRLPSGRS